MTTSTPDPYRRNEHAHRAILDAALAVIGERGYERASIDAIAQRAGVGKQTIYRWWPSKGAVVLEALRDSFRTMAEYPDSGDIVEDLRTRMNRVWQQIVATEVGPAYRGLIGAAQSDPALARATMEHVIEPAAAAARERLARAKERGELRADADIQALIDMFNGALYYRLLLDTRPLEPEQIDAILDIALNGLR